MDRFITKIIDKPVTYVLLVLSRSFGMAATHPRSSVVALTVAIVGNRLLM